MQELRAGIGRSSSGFSMYVLSNISALCVVHELCLIIKENSIAYQYDSSQHTHASFRDMKGHMVHELCLEKFSSYQEEFDCIPI